MRLPGSKLWTPGICIEEVAPRSYRVKVGDAAYRRNRRQLIATKEEVPNDNESSDEGGQSTSEPTNSTGNASSAEEDPSSDIAEPSSTENLDWNSTNCTHRVT